MDHEEHEICEIIPRIWPVNLPTFSPFLIPITAWYLYFGAAQNGDANEPRIHASGSTGRLTPDELDLVQTGSLDFREDKDRRAAVDDIKRKLVADGWEYVGQGTYWYSARFRRILPKSASVA